MRHNTARDQQVSLCVLQHNLLHSLHFCAEQIPLRCSWIPGNWEAAPSWRKKRSKSCSASRDAHALKGKLNPSPWTAGTETCCTNSDCPGAHRGRFPAQTHTHRCAQEPPHTEHPAKHPTQPLHQSTHRSRAGIKARCCARASDVLCKGPTWDFSPGLNCHLLYAFSSSLLFRKADTRSYWTGWWTHANQVARALLGQAAACWVSPNPTCHNTHPEFVFSGKLPGVSKGAQPKDPKGI